MTRPISSLVVAWVSAQQRHFHNSTRGVATPEQRIEWEREAEAIIAAHDREVAAQALRDAAKDATYGGRVSWDRLPAPGRRSIASWLRARADQIEKGGGQVRNVTENVTTVDMRRGMKTND